MVKISCPLDGLCSGKLIQMNMLLAISWYFVKESFDFAVILKQFRSAISELTGLTHEFFRIHFLPSAEFGRRVIGLGAMGDSNLWRYSPFLISILCYSVKFDNLSLE